MIDIIKKLLQDWAKSDAKNANERQLARHISKIALYELKGKDALYPDVKRKYELLEAKMSELGKDIFLVEGFRTAKKQNGYYDKGRSSPGNIVTNAKGLQSYHQYALAFDVAFKKYKWNPPNHSWWKTLGEEGEKLGLEWGGSFQDWGHLSWHPNFYWQDLIHYFHDESL